MRALPAFATCSTRSNAPVRLLNDTLVVWGLSFLAYFPPCFPFWAYYFHFLAVLVFKVTPGTFRRNVERTRISRIFCRYEHFRENP